MASLDRLSQLEAQCRSVPGVVLSAAVYVPLVVSSTASSSTRGASEGSGVASSTSRRSGGDAGDGGVADGSMAQGAHPASGVKEGNEAEAEGGGELYGGVRRALQRGCWELFGFKQRSWLRGVGPRGPQGLGQQQHAALAAAEQQLQVRGARAGAGFWARSTGNAPCVGLPQMRA